MQAADAPTNADGKALADMLSSVNRWYDRAPASPAPGAFAAPPRGLSMPYDVREQAVTAQAGIAYNGFAHSFAGMGVQFLLFACMDLAIGMLIERQLGLWKRLRAAPISRVVLLGAKATSGAIISLLSLGVTFAFGMPVFGIRVQGSWPGFLAVCVATALMAAAFGLLIAALGKTPQATRGVAILAVLLMVMLGGAWVPTFAPSLAAEGDPGHSRALGGGRPGRHDVARRRLHGRTARGRGAAGLRGAVRRPGRRPLPLGRGLTQSILRS